MTEKDNEKLSMEEMEEMAGGAGIDGLFLNVLRLTCSKCGTVNGIGTGAQAIPKCYNCGAKLIDI